MTTTRHIPLNPCDYLLYGDHRKRIRVAEGGNIAYMFFEVDGHPDPDWVNRALASAMSSHPVTMASLRISITQAKPYWRVPASLEESAKTMAQKAHKFVDLRHIDDWRDRLAHICSQGTPGDWNLQDGPQVRLEQIALPDGRTVLCLRWPHCLMDAEGAQWFLAELSQDQNSSSGTDEADPALHLASDGQNVNVLKDYAFIRRLGLIRRGALGQREQGHFKIMPPPLKHSSPTQEHRVLHQHWDVEQAAVIKANAGSSVARGPALYARFLASSVLCALHRLYNKCDWQTEAYKISFPLRVRLPTTQRPVHGNYLVLLTIIIPKECVDTKRAIDANILQQLQEYRQHKIDLAQWTLMWSASFIPVWFYDLIFRLPLGNTAFSSGFSYYGEIASPLRSLGGFRVTNLWGGGPTTTPPGWNPVFSRFGDKLNLTLTYSWPIVSDELASRYAELIESELFQSS